MATKQVKLEQTDPASTDLVQKTVSDGKTLHFHPTLLKYFYAKIKKKITESQHTQSDACFKTLS